MIRTKRGRVVYDRPPTKFTCKDVFRIVRSLDTTREDLAQAFFCLQDVFIYVFRLIDTGSRELDISEDLDKLLDAMKGYIAGDTSQITGFGGAGATGEF